MEADLFFTDVLDFKKKLSEVADAYPLYAEQSLSSAGNRMRQMLKEESPSTVDDHPKKLNKSWHGKISTSSISSKSTQYDIWTTAPHYHLVNNGHVQLAPSGKPVRFVQGAHFFEKVSQAVESDVLPITINKLYNKIKRKIGD